MAWQKRTFNFSDNSLPCHDCPFDLLRFKASTNMTPATLRTLAIFKTSFMRAGAAYATTAVTLTIFFYTMMSSAWYGGTFTGNMSAVSLDRVAIATT